MTHPKELLEEELHTICRLIGRTTDQVMLRRYFIAANALWARIDRLTSEPAQCA